MKIYLRTVGIGRLISSIDRGPISMQVERFIESNEKRIPKEIMIFKK